MVRQQVRVLVRSADSLSVVGLASLLESSPDISVVPGERRDSADVVVVAAHELSADVVVELYRATAAAPVPVVLVLDELEGVAATTIAECWVVAVLPRAAVTGHRLSRSVLDAAAGGGPLAPDVVEDLLQQARSLQQEMVAPKLRGGRLTPREVELLRLLAEGLDTGAIAAKLSYSERTVKNVLYGITTRLNLRNRAHAVAYALRNGLI